MESFDFRGRNEYVHSLESVWLSENVDFDDVDAPVPTRRVPVPEIRRSPRGDHAAGCSSHTRENVPASSAAL
jgi:hypothetical protein